MLVAEVVVLGAARVLAARREVWSALLLLCETGCR